VRPSRVLIGDDHTLVVEGLRRILEPEFEVAGTANDGEALVREALRLQPDAIVINISLPLVDGLEAARRIKKRQPGVKIVFLTIHSNLGYLREAFRLGASGYLLKRSSGKDLLQALREAIAGRTYVGPETTKQIQDPELRKAFESGQVPELTERQREVLKLIASGQSDEEIARQLSITARTVRFHRVQIARKLGVAGPAELTKTAVAYGLVRPEQTFSGMGRHGA